jgi:hypothetical protein
MMRPAELRRRFARAFLRELRIVWPILSGLIVAQLALGVVISGIEGWPLGQGAYFTFVTGLTIGYGDFVPKRFSTRLAAVIIGFLGILVTGLMAAVAVRALQEATSEERR